MKFPHSAQQIRDFGAKWLTEAFHNFKTIPSDNEVSRLVSVVDVPISGFDCCGGSGPKVFITVEYSKPDPALHTELFAKMPWDPQSAYPGVPAGIPEDYRFQTSGMSDMEAREVECSALLETFLPFPTPKCYFCDVCGETTNYILICERIAFGRRDIHEQGKVVEKVERQPYDILPLCGKKQDFLLDDAPAFYYQLMRAMAQLSAWDHQGRYDKLLGPLRRFTIKEWMAKNLPRKPMTKKVSEVEQKAAMLKVDPALIFAAKIAPHLFSQAAVDPKHLKQVRDHLKTVSLHLEDIRGYLGNTSDFMGVQHGNLEIDKAYFWRDENDELDCGVLDFGGLGRDHSYVVSILGCLSGAEYDLLAGHEQGLLECFCQEFERYGGPPIQVQELLLRCNLCRLLSAFDTCQWIDRSVLMEIPKEEWETIKSRFDAKLQGAWNARCRTTALINMLDFWAIRDLGGTFQTWKSGVGKPYLTPIKEPRKRVSED